MTRLLASVLAAAAVAAACTSNSPAGDVVYTISEADSGATRRADDLADLQALAPFTIVAPLDLPPDLKLKSVQLNLPSPSASPELRRTATGATLIYESDHPELPGIALFESVVAPGLGGPGEVRTVVISANRGEYVRGTERTGVTVAWPACGIGFALSSGFSATDEAVLEVAEALSSACER